jgi:hypothetical protein
MKDEAKIVPAVIAAVVLTWILIGREWNSRFDAAAVWRSCFVARDRSRRRLMGLVWYTSRGLGFESPRACRIFLVQEELRTACYW